MQYCVLANHFWFFGEAVYLHSVLIGSVFINHNKHLPYICLGWGKATVTQPAVHVDSGVLTVILAHLFNVLVVKVIDRVGVCIRAVKRRVRISVVWDGS